MNDQDLTTYLRRLYWLTALFTAIGFLLYFWAQGLKPAAAFALGGAGSLGNLWLFQWLSRAITEPNTILKTRWRALLFIGRYAILLASGYVIVKALDVGPLAVILGLLASAAAVLGALIFEMIQSIWRKASTN